MSRGLMRAYWSWQTGRLRCPPVVQSSVNLVSPAQCAVRIRDPLQPFGLLGYRSIATESSNAGDEEFWVGKEIKERVEELQNAGIEPYPRRESMYPRSSFAKFERAYRKLQNGETQKDSVARAFDGRILSVRTSGRLLFFMDIFSKNKKLQIVVNFTQLLDVGMTEEDFVARCKLLRRGDVIGVAGYAHRTESGELSLIAIEFPCLLSPCLHKFPVQKPAQGGSPQNEPQYLDRHMEMLAKPEVSQLFARKSQVMRHMRKFLYDRSFVEVQTPILSTSAGGAVAKSFRTSAIEFPSKELSLRVAPELWLKRLMVGGMERIFEIGQCFRNEGIDSLHNPEFTTCEFYLTHTPIQILMNMTRDMLQTIVTNIELAAADHEKQSRSDGLRRYPMPAIALDSIFFKGPYRQIDFMMALNDAIGRRLPDLGAESATAELVEIFEEKEISLPAEPTLPRLLDKLSATFLEPQCVRPTWIINHPECLSPLSKSFLHPSPHVAQPVAARAELFIHRHEIVNCYEEENSPFEQKRKFLMQQQFVAESSNTGAKAEAMEMDEEYLKALEWGLPPAAGWGCGIDRLVMLLTGKQRISDVLTFGTLRSVTRSAQTRDTVRLAKSPMAVARKDGSQQTDDLEAPKVRASEAIESAPFHPDERVSKSSAPMDSAEEAVLRLKEKLDKEKSRGMKQGQDEGSTASGKQKRLAIWLADKESPDSADSQRNN